MFKQILVLLILACCLFSAGDALAQSGAMADGTSIADASKEELAYRIGVLEHHQKLLRRVHVMLNCVLIGTVLVSVLIWFVGFGGGKAIWNKVQAWILAKQLRSVAKQINRQRVHSSSNN